MNKIEEAKHAALSALSVEQRINLSIYIDMLGGKWDDGTYTMPSYTHPESGASHALSDLSSDILDYNSVSLPTGEQSEEEFSDQSSASINPFDMPK